MKNLIKITVAAMFVAGSLSLAAGAALAKDHKDARETHKTAQNEHSQGRDSREGADHRSADRPNGSLRTSQRGSDSADVCLLTTTPGIDCLKDNDGASEASETSNDGDMSVDGANSLLR